MQNFLLKLAQQSNKNLQLQVEAYVSNKTKKEELHGFLRLDLGENILNPNPVAYAAIRNVEAVVLREYADPSGSRIKQVISEIHGCDSDQILIANSSNELIEFVARTFIDKEDSTVIVHPNFFRFAETTLKCEGKIENIHAREADGFEYTEELIEEIIWRTRMARAKLVWLSNPVNPVGNTITRKQLERILNAVDAIVVADEAFIEYAPHESAIPLTRMHSNLIVLRTLSKAYGLAGIRFGYFVANQRITEVLSKLLGTLHMTSALAQYCAEAVLSDKSWLMAQVGETERLRNRLHRDVLELGKYEIGGKSKTNIFLLRHIDGIDLHKELKNRRIFTSDFSKVPGLSGRNYLRITVGCEKDNETLLSALKDIASAYGKS